MIYYAKYGTAWSHQGYQLVDRNTGQYKTAPTLAAEDFKIEKDGGTAVALAAVPTVTPSGGSSVKLSFTASEMQCQQAVLRMSDASGAEWNDDCIHIFTVGDPSAYMQYDPFLPTVGLSAPSMSALVALVWNALRTNHQIAGSFGEGAASVQGDVTGSTASVTGNVVGNVVGVVGGVAPGGIGASSFSPGAITGATVDTTASQSIADEFLNRNLVGGASGGSRNVRNALRTLRNRVRVNGPSLEVYQEDDSTLAWTAATTTSASNPITEIDPT